MLVRDGRVECGSVMSEGWWVMNEAGRVVSEGWRVINEYLHLGSSTEHGLQSLHEVFHLGWEWCVLGREKEQN